MSYDTAEPIEAVKAVVALREALAVPDGPLRDAAASLDAAERARLTGALSASDPARKTCQAMLRGFPHCGNPAIVRCVEGWLGRGYCEDSP